MLADFFTKPLQGALFEKFKSVIMVHKHISILHDPSNKERVEIDENVRKNSNDVENTTENIQEDNYTEEESRSSSEKADKENDVEKI